MPVGPVGPDAPTTPVAPVIPVGPVAPVAPVAPEAPSSPSTSVSTKTVLILSDISGKIGSMAEEIMLPTVLVRELLSPGFSDCRTKALEIIKNKRVKFKRRAPRKAGICQLKLGFDGKLGLIEKSFFSRHLFLISIKSWLVNLLLPPRVRWLIIFPSFSQRLRLVLEMPRIWAASPIE